MLFVVAKAVGRTSVAALDADSELIGEWTIATVLDIQPVRAAFEGVPALRNVVVRQLNRGVELSGPVASIAEADLALRLTTTALPEETPVENRLSVTGKQQVNLEVQIAEVQREVSETLGFNWEVLPDIGSERNLGMRVGRFFFDDDIQKYIMHTLPGGQAPALFGSTGVRPGRTMVRGLIDALATAGLATVLARPNVTAVSGETASFFSGGEYPLPAGFEDGAIIFEYKKYGVLLDFVPTIIDSGRIMLTVRPEVSQRSDTDSLQVTGINIPVINVRRAETTVEVGDGESIVIAGLYRDQSEAVEAGLPVGQGYSAAGYAVRLAVGPLERHRVDSRGHGAADHRHDLAPHDRPGPPPARPPFARLSLLRRTPMPPNPQPPIPSPQSLTHPLLGGVARRAGVGSLLRQLLQKRGSSHLRRTPMPPNPQSPIPNPQSLTLPLLLAVAAICAGCAVVPLSFHQTLPSTRMALSGIEEARRSLDDIGTDHAESLAAAPPARPVAAYGATHGAYERWATDEVRELPDVSQTIAIGGGDT